MNAMTKAFEFRTSDRLGRRQQDGCAGAWAAISRWVPRLVLLLALAAAALTTMAGVTQARYVEEDVGGSSADVASWRVVTTEDNPPSLVISADEQDGATYSFTISNEGKVAAKYSVVVEAKSSVLRHISVQLSVNDGPYKNLSSISTDDKTGVTTRQLKSAGTLAIGTSATCKLKFSVPDGYESDGEPFDVTVFANATQINTI